MQQNVVLSQTAQNKNLVFLRRFVTNAIWSEKEDLIVMEFIGDPDHQIDTNTIVTFIDEKTKKETPLKFIEDELHQHIGDYRITYCFAPNGKFLLEDSTHANQPIGWTYYSVISVDGKKRIDFPLN